jgi:hypothetical protein
MCPNKKLRTEYVEYHKVRVEIKKYVSTDSAVGRSISMFDDSRNCNEVAGKCEVRSRQWP